MSWRRTGVWLAVLVSFAAGLATTGVEGFVHSFLDTLDAGAVGFFLISVLVTWLLVAAARLVTRRRNPDDHPSSATGSR